MYGRKGWRKKIKKEKKKKRKKKRSVNDFYSKLINGQGIF